MADRLAGWSLVYGPLDALHLVPLDTALFLPLTNGLANLAAAKPASDRFLALADDPIELGLVGGRDGGRSRCRLSERGRRNKSDQRHRQKLQHCESPNDARHSIAQINK